MRVKGGKVQTRKRKKWLNLAKGYFGAKSKQYRTAKAQVMKSALYAYRDRRQRRRDMRRLWIIRVNAGVRLHDLSYSKFIHGLKLADVIIDRKMLSELAIHDPAAFGAVVELAKKALGV
ncbi:MAG: 50S ribosomal protein L20 [Armatimonadetes bacterium]|nr:50S ribosomal protein L20 [Armatimonadota bacterium]